jgi:hypothetical protein
MTDNVTPFPSKPDHLATAMDLLGKLAGTMAPMAQAQQTAADLLASLVRDAEARKQLAIDTAAAVMALHAQVAELTNVVRLLLGIVVVAANQQQNRDAAGRGVPTSESSDTPAAT